MRLFRSKHLHIWPIHKLKEKEKHLQIRTLSPSLAPGWPDLAIFHQLGFVWKLIIIFWKDEVAQRNGDILGYFWRMQIHYTFTEIVNF
jgi:hypothetical protein